MAAALVAGVLARNENLTGKIRDLYADIARREATDAGLLRAEEARAQLAPLLERLFDRAAGMWLIVTAAARYPELKRDMRRESDRLADLHNAFSLGLAGAVADAPARDLSGRVRVLLAAVEARLERYASAPEPRDGAALSEMAAALSEYAEEPSVAETHAEIAETLARVAAAA